MQTPTIGRIVHYVRENGDHRPAIIVHVWPSDDPAFQTVQLQVFMDSDAEGKLNDGEPAVSWKTSVVHDQGGKAPYSWHWPEQEGAELV